MDGGHISDKRLIELMANAPMKLMGHTPTDITALLDEQQGAVGGTKRVLDLRKVDDAARIGLAVLNTAEQWTVDPERFHSKARNTPFGGWQVSGRPLATIIGASLAFSRL